jgi:ribonuclease E
VEPEKPRVVTRTRRRSASRPAGPPAASLVDPAGADGSPSAVASAEPGAADGDAVPHAVEHVPIKKKGSRKR